VDEVQQLATIASQPPLGSASSTHASSVDFTTGIYQAIGTAIDHVMTLLTLALGYRELFPYVHQNNHSDKNRELLLNGLETMKLATHKYAKRQVSWLKNKLVPIIHASNKSCQLPHGQNKVSAYVLDANGDTFAYLDLYYSNFILDVGSMWMDNVQLPAIAVMEGDWIP
jgi:tRNA dimethylallyltransferase